MKRLARILIPALLMASAILAAGHSSASSNNLNEYVFESVYLTDSKNDADKRKEFWDKFRESVTPREKKPGEAHSPREVKPREVHPREVRP
ncbi:MAG: hypothetical protein J5809_00670 [Selenomonadaceae bacterium]|nr:hypothetical protein [Selenomonadaceae bacterium]